MTFLAALAALALAAYAVWRVSTLSQPAVAPDLSAVKARLAALEGLPVPRDPDTVVTIKE